MLTCDKNYIANRHRSCAGGFKHLVRLQAQCEMHASEQALSCGRCCLFVCCMYPFWWITTRVWTQL